MTDNSPRLAPLGWGKRDPEHDQDVFNRGVIIALRVLLETEGQSVVEVCCALGAAHPFTSKSDKMIWLGAIEEARSLKATLHREEIVRLIRVNGGGR